MTQTNTHDRDTRRRAVARLAGLTVAGATAWQVFHRSSAAVRAWEPPGREPVLGGPLAATATPVGADGPVVVLLHGITASGTSYGAAYDRLGVPVAVPDLLGFGRSMWVESSEYSREDHVTAVVQTLQRAGVADRPILVVGHSMGAVLALGVAGALPNVFGVVAMSAPLYDSESEGLGNIGSADPLARFIATGNVAERMCHWMCEHRALARVTWPLLAPKWPRPVAQDGVLHTWPGYRCSLQSLVLDSDYRTWIRALDDKDVPVVLVNGSDDGVPVVGRATDLVGEFENCTSVQIEGAGHALPVSHPNDCVAIIEAALRTAT